MLTPSLIFIYTNDCQLLLFPQTVGSEVDSDTSLNDYIRNVLNLRGTKFMCKEGGCGACIVAVTTSEDGERKTFSVNSVSAYCNLEVFKS